MSFEHDVIISNQRMRIDRLQSELTEIHEIVGGQDDEMAIDAVRDMMTERQHYVRLTNRAEGVTIPRLQAERDAVYRLIDRLMAPEDEAEPPGLDSDGYGEIEVWAFCRRPANGPHWDGCPWEQLRNLVYLRERDAHQPATGGD